MARNPPKIVITGTGARVEGVKNVLRNLGRSNVEIGKALERGLVKAGLFLQRKSQQVVPVDTGNLKNSAYTRKHGTGHKTEVSVGYTAIYAIFVHENLRARHKPGKIAKYLERPARENRAQLRTIIKTEMEKVK